VSNSEAGVNDGMENDGSAYEAEEKSTYEVVMVLLAQLDVLWAARRKILRGSLVVGVLTLIVTFLIPKEYTASSDINPPDMNPASGLSILIGMKSGLGALGGGMGDMLGLKSPGEVYIRQMRSRVVEDRIIDRFDLMKVYKTKRRLETRIALEANTDMTEDRKSGVITVKVTDKDPSRAAKMADAFPEELGRVLADLGSLAGKREREYFEQQLTSAQRDLDAATRELSKFSGNTGALDVAEQGRALIAGSATVEGQLIAAQSELKGLQQIYTDSHERVQQAKAQIRELQRQLAQMKGKDTKGSDTEDVKALASLATPYLERYRRMKVEEAVVDTIEQQYTLAKFQESRHVSEVQVLSPAEVPEKKSFPRRGITTLAMMLVTFLVLSSWTITATAWSNLEAENPWKVALTPRIEAAVKTAEPVMLRVRAVSRPFARVLAVIAWPFARRGSRISEPGQAASVHAENLPDPQTVNTQTSGD
jgi:uncharacterized protein involved in exopolysaccharide biosynthesis